MEGSTVYILGAGSSVELSVSNSNKFPDGSSLKHIIADSFKLQRYGENQNIANEIMQQALVELSILNGDIDRSRMREYVHASQQIRNAMPLAPSIDNFVHAHNDNDKILSCAKIAIVKTILDAERNCRLTRSASNDGSFYQKYRILEDTWYAKYFWNLIEGCTFEDIGEKLSKTKFVIFNYDRCFEYFIFDALQTYFDIDDETTKEILSNLDIFHAYGKVGSLGWQDESNVISFGAKLNASQLISLSSEIRTFAEDDNSKSGEIAKIRSVILDSKKYVFLGYAFHELNMQILKHPQSSMGVDGQKTCFGTAFGFSEANIELIKAEKLCSQLGLRKDSVHIDHLTCAEMLSHYSFKLSQ